MLVPAEVIRRAERFKSSIAITPLPDACHLHRDTERSAPAIPEPEGNTTSQHPISGLDKHLPSTKGCWKMETEGFAAGVWRRTRFSQQRFLCPFFPTHPQPLLPHVFQPGLQQPASLQGKYTLMGCSPHSAWLKPFGIVKPTSAN